MYQDDWKIKVRSHPASFNEEIWIIRYLPDGKVEVMDGKGGSYLKEIQPVDIHLAEPTLIIPHDIFNKLVDVLTAGKPPERPYTEGKLEGTERHLQDLRKLLKL